MKILLWIWQLPQHLLGLLLISYLEATDTTEYGIKYYYFDKYKKRVIDFSYFSGVSLGSYILLPLSANKNTILHEHGHSKQSLIFGWLYLLVIGIPSLCNNLWDRWFHKTWSGQSRHDWYYSRYPEKWADKLGGGVSRWM